MFNEKSKLVERNFCPICNKYLEFKPFGPSKRKRAQCPICGSLERHRLIYLLFNKRYGKLLKEKLIGSLFTDEFAEEDAGNVLKELAAMGCPVPAPFYTVVDAAFTPTGTGQEAASVLAETSGGIVHTSASRTGTRLFVLGNSAEDAEEVSAHPRKANPFREADGRKTESMRDVILHCA